MKKTLVLTMLLASLAAATQTTARTVTTVAPPPAETCDGSPFRTYRCEGPDGGTETSGYVAVVPGTLLSINGERFPLGVGGQHFQTPSDVLSITVEDRNGPGVPVIVCQDHLSDGRGTFCRDHTDADVIVEFCSTPEPVSLTDHGFRPGFTKVIVGAADTRCATPATTGTITIAW